MKYIKLFDTHNPDYVNYINDDNCILPNLSFCKDIEDIHLNKINYSKFYLTFIALEDGEFNIIMQKTLQVTDMRSISYSYDNGNTWETFENIDNESITIYIPVQTNDHILLKGDADTLMSNTLDNNSHLIINSTINFNIQGNIMSLLYGDNFKNNNNLINPNSFGNLFLNNVNLINAKNLILPATTLVNYCYYGMFRGCASLTSVPELPAATLANSCYSRMFSGCTSLTSAPELPATTLTDYCYSNMFYGCTTLTTAPELPATTLTDYCYSSMFRNCTSLTTPPSLPATTLA